jgi:hypothetical protein
MTIDRFLKPTRQLLWPHGPWEKIGRVGAVLSMVGWARAGFHFELGPILLAALEKYEKLVNFLLGWADPYISIALKKIAEWFGWHLHLHPHWRHVFVLIGLYCFRGARADYKEGNLITGTFRLVMGFVIAHTTHYVRVSVPSNSPATDRARRRRNHI